MNPTYPRRSTANIAPTTMADLNAVLKNVDKSVFVKSRERKGD
jgi:hypothetical protein